MSIPSWNHRRIREFVGVALAIFAVVAFSSVAIAQQPDGENPESAPFGSLDDLGPSEGEAPAEGADSAEPDENLNLDAPRAKADVIDAYQVRLAETDYMAGRLRVRNPVTGDVRGIRTSSLIILDDGEVIRRVRTGVEGVAQIETLPEGTYSAILQGRDGVAAFGFEVLPAVTGVTVPSYRFDLLIVPVPDMAVAGVGRSAEGGAPVPAPLPSGAADGTAGNPIPAPLPPIPASMVQGDSNTQAQPPAGGADQFAVANVAAPLKGESIVLAQGQPSGGQIVIPDSETGRSEGLANAQVSFIREGQVLGSVTTDENGYCGVGGLEEGIYSMVGYGDNGFVAVGVRVVDPTGDYSPAVAKEDPKGEAYVAAFQPASPNVTWRVGGAPSNAMSYFPGPGGGAGFPPPPGPPGAGGGGFGGGAGFGGGGGGFGGGGLLGALLGAGLGAGIGAAIASDDDDDSDESDRPVSPFRPPRR